MTSNSDYTAEESPPGNKPKKEESPMTIYSSADDKEESQVTKITNDQHEIKDKSENQTKVS